MNSQLKRMIMTKKIKKDSASKLNIGDVVRIRDDDLKGTIYIMDSKNKITKILQDGMEVTASSAKPGKPMVTMKEDDYLDRFFQVVSIEKDAKKNVVLKFSDAKPIKAKQNDKISVVR